MRFLINDDQHANIICKLYCLSSGTDADAEIYGFESFTIYMYKVVDTIKNNEDVFDAKYDVFVQYNHTKIPTAHEIKTLMDIITIR